MDDRPLNKDEQSLLNILWVRLWPADACSIIAAMKVLKSEGYDVVHRAAYDMVLRTRPMPEQYWPNSEQYD